MKLAKRLLGIGLAVVVGFGLTLTSAVSNDAKAWEPKKPVELIIMAGTGGGADQMARLIQGIIQKNDMSPRPFIPINKPGGSGAEALRYLKDKEGDNHTVMITLNSFYTTPIIQKGLGVDPLKFTPLGRMALDTFLLWVHTDRSDITDLDSYVSAVKSAGRDWKMGGTGKGQEDSILTAMMENEFGVDMTYIPFPGGGTVAKNLIGGHINSTVNNPAEQNEFWRAGKSKPLVQFTPARMDLYPDVPTMKELGHDIVYFMQRSFNGPPGMSSEARDWYIKLFSDVFHGDEWQTFCKDDGIFCDEWVAGDDLAAFHKEQLKRHEDLIKAVGADALSSE